MEIDFKKMVDGYRITYHTFEKYEGRKWGAAANIMETYKQIGEMIYWYQKKDKERFADELLDVFCQFIRLLDFYQYDVYEVFAMLEQYKKEIGTTIEENLLIVSQKVGLLSEYIMMNEKYYFRSRSKNEKYAVTKEKIYDCIANSMKCILEIAEEEQINLNEISEQARKIDQEHFPIIEKQEKDYQ